MTQNQCQFIRVSEPDGGVVTLTLNRPEKKNALSIALRDEVTAALEALAEEEALKVVILTGAGTAFSAGFDLKEFAGVEDPKHHQRLWESSDRFHRAVLEFPLPIIAAVNGPALAGGFDLAVFCDLRIAADSAVFGHPEITFSDVVYAPLHDLVGGALARELCLTGRQLTAVEALALRIVSAVVPAAELEAESRRWAAQIVRAPREVLKRTKAKIIRRAAVVFQTTLEL